MAKKKNKNSITTEHLILTPMTVAELDSLAAYNEDPDVKASFAKMAELVAVNPKNEMWYTNWKIALKSDRTVIGGAGFTGYPNDRKATGIHCSLLDMYLGENYMTEAVKALADLALHHDDCLTIRIPASTVTEMSEYANLSKAGFRREIADDGTLTYTREKPPTYHVAIFTLFGMLFGIGTGLIISDVILVPMLIGVFCGFVVGMLLDILDRKKRETIYSGNPKAKKEKKAAVLEEQNEDDTVEVENFELTEKGESNEEHSD